MRTARLRMVQELCEQRGIVDTRVLDALREVERHRFVDDAWADHAYEPRDLPIGAGQILPHPHLAALSIQALQLRGDERVLEIGAGSGYQTAILAGLASRVWSTECFAVLQQRAQANLRDCGPSGRGSVEIRWQASLDLGEPSGFDAILVAAAAPEVPGQLLAQLAPGGRLVIPVGRGSHQRLLLLRRRGGSVVSQHLGSCRLPELLGRQPGPWPGQVGTQPV
jgi:protein-L-isoaspartate(D-aspartate) O-methyltransferase